MNCPSCKHPNSEQRSYCGGCGAALARYCSHCGFRNLKADRYCGGCGAGLEAGLDAPRPAASSPAAAPPAPSQPAAGGDDLAELLAAAKEGAAQKPDDGSAKVSQDDIDSLFGD